MHRKGRRVSWHVLVGLGWAAVIGTLSLAAEPPASDLWAFAAAERHEGRPALTSHRDVAGLLGAMLDGDAAVMFRDPPRFQTLSVEQFKNPEAPAHHLLLGSGVIVDPAPRPRTNQKNDSQASLEWAPTRV